MFKAARITIGRVTLARHRGNVSGKQLTLFTLRVVALQDFFSGALALAVRHFEADVWTQLAMKKRAVVVQMGPARRQS